MELERLLLVAMDFPLKPASFVGGESITWNSVLPVDFSRNPLQFLKKYHHQSRLLSFLQKFAVDTIFVQEYAILGSN